jgi:hypothetical protein
MDLAASIKAAKAGQKSDPAPAVPPKDVEGAVGAIPMDLAASIKSAKAGQKAAAPPPPAPPPPPKDIEGSQGALPMDLAASIKSAKAGQKSSAPASAPAKKDVEGSKGGLPMDLAASIKGAKAAQKAAAPAPAPALGPAEGGAPPAPVPALPMDLAASIKSAGAGGKNDPVAGETKPKKGKLADSWMKKSEPEPEPEPAAAGGAGGRELLIDGVSVAFAHARFGKSKAEIDASAVAAQPIKCDDFIGNVVDLSGNIAVAERGVITFVEKAIKVQNAGAGKITSNR